MIKLHKARRQRKAVELICEMLEIDDKQIDDFISGVNDRVSKEALAIKEKADKAKAKERAEAEAKVEKLADDKVKVNSDNLAKARKAKAKLQKEKEKALKAKEVKK